MLYKFKSKAAGDVIMLEQNASQVLRIIGREPQASGILEVAAMPAATAALEAAVAEEEQARRDAEAEAAGACSAAPRWNSSIPPTPPRRRSSRPATR